MSKRRVRLGSGLDPHKLAGTVRQIAVADPPLPALVCHLVEDEDGWIHLTAITGPSGGHAPAVLTGWKLMFGCSAQEPPSELLRRLAINLPAGAHIDEWEAGIFASIHLPTETSPEAVAALIAAIAHRLQNADAARDIETALEYP